MEVDVVVGVVVGVALAVSVGVLVWVWVARGVGVKPPSGSARDQSAKVVTPVMVAWLAAGSTVPPGWVRVVPS